MPENTDAPAQEGDPVVTASPGLVELLAEAEKTWISRARDAHGTAKPGWRPFEDAFPTFYQFTNRPR